MIVALLGLQGSGKDTLLRYLVENYDIKPIISHTTRPMRKGEVDGRDYYFVSDEEFDKLDLIEKRKYKTVYGIWKYGISRQELEKEGNKIVIVDYDGLLSLIKKADEKVVSYFISADKKTRRERVMKREAYSLDEFERRDENDLKSMKRAISRVTDIIFNDDTLTHTIKELEACLRREGVIE